MHIAQGGFVITYQKRHKNMLVADHEKNNLLKAHYIILYYSGELRKSRKQENQENKKINVLANFTD